MSGMKHPNVVDLKDVVKDYPPGSRPGGGGQQKKMLIMIMEKLTGGELFSEVLDNGASTRQPASQPASRPAERTRAVLWPSSPAPEVRQCCCSGRRRRHRLRACVRACVRCRGSQRAARAGALPSHPGGDGLLPRATARAPVCASVERGVS